MPTVVLVVDVVAVVVVVVVVVLVVVVVVVVVLVVLLVVVVSCAVVGAGTQSISGLNAMYPGSQARQSRVPKSGATRPGAHNSQ
jgi:hypothetical protein